MGGRTGPRVQVFLWRLRGQLCHVNACEKRTEVIYQVPDVFEDFAHCENRLIIRKSRPDVSGMARLDIQLREGAGGDEVTRHVGG